MSDQGEEGDYVGHGAFRSTGDAEGTWAEQQSSAVEVSLCACANMSADRVLKRHLKV